MDEIDYAIVLGCYDEPDDIIKLYDGKNPMKISTDTKSAIYKYNNYPIDIKYLQTLSNKYQFDDICFIMSPECDDFFSNLILAKLLLKVNRITICSENDIELYFHPTITRIKKFSEKKISIYGIHVDSFDFLSRCDKMLSVYIELDIKKLVLPDNHNSPFYRLKQLHISNTNFELSKLPNLSKSCLVQLELEYSNCSDILKFIPLTLKKLKLTKFNFPDQFVELYNSRLESLEIVRNKNINNHIADIIPKSLKILILRELYEFNQSLNLTDTNLHTVELYGLLQLF